MHIPQQAAFFRRDLWQKVGPLDPSFFFAMDYDLWVRIAKVAPLLYTRHVWANFRLHGDSKTLIANDRCCMMKRVDFIIAGNQFLKGEALRYNPNVEVIPTSIDLSRYKAKENLRPEGAVTVGWLGSGSTLKYLKTMMRALESLYEEHPHFRLKVVCDQFVESDRLPVIKKAWSSDEEQSDLRSFDIGIMPLVDDLWSKGKCGFNILQYYGVGVPAVCTPVGVNQDLVEHGVNGFWARNEQEWISHLLTLMQAETLRKEMGLRGRRAVEADYSSWW